MDMSTNMPVMPMYGGYGNGMFGNGNDWFAFLILAMLFGWGGNGWGNGFGGRGAGIGAFNGGELLADQFALQDLKNGQRQIDSGIRGLERGICDLGYSLAQQEGQTREAIAGSTYSISKGLCDVSHQISDCCCTTNRNIDAVRYENAKNTCDIITNQNMNTRDLIEAGNANTQRIVDMMTQDKIQSLRDQNSNLLNLLSQREQTAQLIDTLRPCPSPAYITCSPYETFGGRWFNGGFGFNGCNNGCC